MAAPGIRIDRCVCFNRTFEGLAAVATAKRASTVVELQRHAEFGRSCRLCVPYVRRMLVTGETCFSVILVDGGDGGDRDG